MTSHRSERVAAVVLEVLTRVLREQTRDPRIGFVTLTEVRISPDLRHAHVFVSALGDPREVGRSIDALNGAAPFFRRALGRESRLRFVPDLLFERDEATVRGFRVETLLREIREESEAAGSTPEEEEKPADPEEPA